VFILQVDNQKAFDTLFFMLRNKIKKYDKEERGNTTYTFFTDEHSHYTLIQDQSGYQGVVVLNQENIGSINLPDLVVGESLKSQLVWDLLEIGGIRQYGFNIMYKGKIPNQEELYTGNDLEVEKS
jgi:hypothetical protein